VDGGTRQRQVGGRRHKTETGWWTEAQDRDSWRAVIKEAKAHKAMERKEFTIRPNLTVLEFASRGGEIKRDSQSRDLPNPMPIQWP
jgi:hypothetical protein